MQNKERFNAYYIQVRVRVRVITKYYEIGKKIKLTALNTGGACYICKRFQK